MELASAGLSSISLLLQTYHILQQICYMQPRSTATPLNQVVVLQVDQMDRDANYFF